jgi:hypothetical protein
VWILRESRLEALRKAEDARLAKLDEAETSARDTLSSFAKQAAKTILPGELKRRFETLSRESADPAMVKLVQAINANREDQASLELLSKWIATLPHRFGNEMVVDSWFINDRKGVQIARSPEDEGSYLHSYKHRDYFHGLGEDIKETDADRLASIEPIRSNNLSLVYRSSTSGLLKVAFSVPIFSPAEPATTPTGGEASAAAGESAAESEREVIGVLAMSVNVTDFTVLDAEFAGGSEVVLIDLRPDFIDRGQEKHGLILHHPRLERGKLARIDESLLARIDAANPNGDLNFDGKDHFLTGYLDPLAPRSGKTFWGAFEPVRYEIGDVEPALGPTDRIGWVVLVQKQVTE